jgi:hypothetical protein
MTVVTERPVTDHESWRHRLEDDALRIRRCLPSPLHELHGAVVERARAAGATGLVLTGSTARGRRTGISDLDYQLVGPRIDTKDLSRQLDLHVFSEGKLRARILAGDDFVQWGLRFGCVVFDRGVLRRSLELIAERRLWPDVERKRAHAGRSLELARRFVASGDVDGAVVQVRTALSLAARAHLLGAGIFPLSRAELPAQLSAVGHDDAAGALEQAIFASPPLDQLATALRRGEALLDYRTRTGAPASPENTAR